MCSWPRLPVVFALSMVVVAGGAGCSRKGATSDVPTVAALGDVIIRYNHVGAGGGGHEQLAVRADGRVATLRDGEQVVIGLPKAEANQLRRDLLGDLDGHDGTIDRTGGATDQPFTVITLVDTDQRVHQVRFEGSERDGWFVVATDRLAALTDRARATGTVDTGAPVNVTLFEDPNTTPVREATWPGGIAPPKLASWIGSQTYTGRDAQVLRKVLGAPLDRVRVRLADGRMLVATWQAVLPGF